MWTPTSFVPNFARGAADAESYGHVVENEGAQFMPPDDVLPSSVTLVVDLGCHSGWTTALYADRWPTARVIGIEATEEDSWWAGSNCAQFSDRVTILNACVGWPERQDQMFLQSCGTVDGIAKYIERPAGLDGTYRNVDVISLDRALAMAGVAGERISLLKIDIEGAEQEVLRDEGAWPGLTDLIYVEVHGKGYSHTDARFDLERLGFTVSQGELGHMIGVHSPSLHLSRVSSR